MTEATRKNQMVPISADTIKAVCVVLDYLWEDERKHFACCQEADAAVASRYHKRQQPFRLYKDRELLKSGQLPLAELSKPHTQR